MTVSQVPNFIRHLGIEFGPMAEGRAEIYLDIQSFHLNSGLVVHGGVLSSIADTVAGAAAFSTLQPGYRVVTTDMHLTCLRNVGEGRITATAKMIHQGRRFMRADVELFAGEALLATGGISFMVVESQPRQ